MLSLHMSQIEGQQNDSGADSILSSKQEDTMSIVPKPVNSSNSVSSRAIYKPAYKAEMPRKTDLLVKEPAFGGRIE